MESVKDLLYRMADDALILGHRNSEWTGIGPTLEEDIAFSSMAQDKIGHAWNLFRILHDSGEKTPDELAFLRDAPEMRNCQLAERYTTDYAEALIRHFFFDHAESLRYTMLLDSAVAPLAQMAAKVKGEVKYHVMHGDVFVRQLGNANADSNGRLQEAVNELYPLALGIFEPGPYEDELRDAKIFDGEAELEQRWDQNVRGLLAEADLKLPQRSSVTPAYGGRSGEHTKDLQPLLDEMGEVFRMNPAVEW